MPRSDDEEGFPPPKRRSTLGIPVIRGDMPEPLNITEIRERMTDIRKHAASLLDDPETPRREVTLEGCTEPVTVVRLGRDWTDQAVELYGKYFRGPALNLLQPADITHLVAFRRPAWATSTWRPTDENTERRPGQVLFALRVKGGKIHYWSAWAMYEGKYETMVRGIWHDLMRAETYPETNAFYNTARAAADSEGRKLTCALCGCSEEPGQTLHVDHAAPAHYARILLDFCRSRGWAREDGSIGTSINARHARPGEPWTYAFMPLVLETVPSTVAADFAEYHRNNMTLRLLCGTCNNAVEQKPVTGMAKYNIGGKIVASDQYPRLPLPPIQTHYYQPVHVDLVPPAALPPAPATSEED